MRADVYLVSAGYAESRQRAQNIIAGGGVTVDDIPVTKPSQNIPDGEHTVVLSDPLRYVSRGGLKLEGALDAFGIDVGGSTALDIGASTGGFTDCLLQRGAEKVVAVDAGEGQLAKKLRDDPRVTSYEHLNARNLTPHDVGDLSFDLIVTDVSFISATYIIPRYPDLLRPEGRAVCLVKPQFEVGRALLGKGGVVRDPEAHFAAVRRVAEAGIAAGLHPVGVIPSPVTGGDGNREFLICFQSTPCGNELTEDEMRRVCGAPSSRTPRKGKEE